MRASKWVLTVAVLSCSAHAWAGDGDGLKWSGDTLSWTRWQARLAISQPAPLWRAGFTEVDSQGLKPRSLSVMGDYLFARSQSDDGRSNVLRATSGLLFGARSTLWAGQPGGHAGPVSDLRGAFAGANAEPSALPYLGIGYSGLGGRGGWSFSADFGLMALGAGNAIRLGRSGSYQGVDELVRELRLTPVLQVGASYSF